MISPALARQIEQALQGLQYGSIHLIIHDAQLVRIERVERTRLTVSAEAPSTAQGQPTHPSEARPMVREMPDVETPEWIVVRSRAGGNHGGCANG